MRITTLTAAKSTALLTLAAVKARLRIAEAVTTHDANLEELIAAVSAAAVRVIAGAGPATADRAIVAQQYLAEQPGSGRDLLLLPRRPIDPVSVSVELDGTALVVDDDYAIASAAQGSLYRRAWWPMKYAAPGGMEGENNVATTFWAGYVPPTVVADWSVGAKAVGAWMRPTNPATSALRFRVTTGGTVSGSEPDWSAKEAGDEFDAGGGVIVVAHELPEVPADLLRGAYFAVESWFRAAPILAGIARDRMGPHEIEYQKQSDALADALPKPTICMWEPLAW